MKIVHINEIKLQGNDPWTEKFNLCSEYFQKWNDESLSEEERHIYGEMWLQERQSLEMGIY